MKKKQKLIYIIAACVCLGIAVVILCCDLLNRSADPYDGGALDELREQVKNYGTTAQRTDTLNADSADVTVESRAVTDEPDIGHIEETTGEPPVLTLPETTQPVEAQTESVAPAMTQPVLTQPAVTTASEPQTLPASMDFDKLWEVNDEICCWLTIPGTGIDYPILQSPDNDKKYLSTAYDGRRYIGGALYTEATYNSKDFNDPVTVIYGHTMRTDSLFGTLQSTYSSETSFKECGSVRIYLPDETRDYTVFAAVPYSDIHLLNTYDFSKPYWYNSFFDGVFGIREIGANFNEDIRPEPGDRVLILSVCFRDDADRRYLVMALNNEDLADNGIGSAK